MSLDYYRLLLVDSFVELTVSWLGKDPGSAVISPSSIHLSSGGEGLK
jgi:hypothetical protein